MSILTKKDLLPAIEAKQLEFTPGIDLFQLQPAAIDLRLGWIFYIPLTWKYTDKGRVAIVADYLDYETAQEHFQLIKLTPGQYFEILPGESIIASTFEKIAVNTGNITGILHPRSSSSRRGLSIESGVIDPYYSGSLIIPIRNNSHHVLKLYPGERICQVVFYEMKETLSAEEASKHGVAHAKYHTATPYSLGMKPDPKEEIDLLRSGKLDLLKEQFSSAAYHKQHE